MAEVLNEVINNYSLENKISAFQTDNASNNDSALEALAISLPGAFDTKQSRLRCFGHIVNLVVKALLFGTASTSLQQELSTVEAGEERAFKIWRE
jgi:hypothetical protein